jgi:dTDP-4-amino-4,6-dideoxygalactose transaminase
VNETGNDGSRWRVPLSDVVVDDRMTATVAETLASGWWSMGPKVEEFEHAFARFCGARHAVAVSSGTAALHLALLAGGLRPGDEVIVPSLNFVAAANVIVHAGGVPVFCDIRGIDDLNLDPVDVAEAVTGRTRMILALHYGGFPCDMDAIVGIAQRHALAVIEDAAHAPGASWRGRKCGTIGVAGCFSFFSNKNLPIGEGGMIVSDDSDIVERARLLRSHGMTTLTWDRHRGHAHTYDVVAHGLNYRLDEIRAAMGLVQLEQLESMNAARRRIVRHYRDLLRGAPGIAVPFGDADTESSAHHLTAVVLERGVDRDAVQAFLRRRGIQTSVHYPPIHRFSAYANTTGAQRALATTDSVADRLLTLPLYPHMHEDQIEAVTSALTEAVSGVVLAVAR